MHLRVVTESSRGRQIPLRLELKEVVNHMTWGWGLNSGPLQEQDMLLTADSLPHITLPST